MDFGSLDLPEEVCLQLWVYVYSGTCAHLWGFLFALRRRIHAQGSQMGLKGGSCM
jgi:hypothetical protein